MMPKSSFTVSHAERMPDAFPDWMRFALRDGKYQPYDLNMPYAIKTWEISSKTLIWKT